MAMVDLAQPYIMLERILKIKIQGVDKLQVEFKLMGCIDVTSVSYVLNDVEETLATEGHCNHLV